MFVSSHQHKPSFGLARTLLSWFLALAILPLIVIGIIEYESAEHTIVESRHDELATMNLILSRQLGHHIDDINKQLEELKQQGTGFTHSIKSLQNNFSNIKQLIASNEYKELTETFQSSTHNYKDASLIIGDNSGNIIYSQNSSIKTGNNIFAKGQDKSDQVEAMKQSINSFDNIHAFHKSSDRNLSSNPSFFVIPLFNETNNYYGFISGNHNLHNINPILNKVLSTNENTRSYIVDKNKTLQYSSTDTPLQSQTTTIDPVISWLDHFDKKGIYQGYHQNNIDHHNNNHHNSHIMVYRSLDGRKVIGASLHIDISGSHILALSEMDYDTAMSPAINFRNKLLFTLGITSIVVFFIAGFVTRRIIKPIQTMREWANQVASGNYSNTGTIKENNEIGELSHSFQLMTEKLEASDKSNRLRNWHQEGLAQLNTAVRGNLSMEALCSNIVTMLSRHLNIPTAILYTTENNQKLQPRASFSNKPIEQIPSFNFGEGLLGQVALEQKSLSIDPQNDQLRIQSGLINGHPNKISLTPIIYNGITHAVFEFATPKLFTDKEENFLKEAIDIIAVAIHSARSKEQVKELLDKMTLQTQTLKEKSESLLLQKREIEFKNHQIEAANKYKSEFLANMSHELRTPLNSILLLTHLLSDNEKNNLDEEQIESVQVINKVGHDLLYLINDILDLSKVEAGKMQIHLESVPLHSLIEQMQGQFQPIAKSKNLKFSITSTVDESTCFATDSQRVMQILKNLLSNAFKFTEQGSITVSISHTPAVNTDSFAMLSFAIIDTGIGISNDQQASIFSAFQQADGSTSRRYGGTGLGLSIAREMAHLLGGEIELQSDHGQGSTFTLLLPYKVCQTNPDDSQAIASSQTIVTASAAPARQLPHELKHNDATMDQPKGFNDEQLKGKKILLVDDNLRNTFALSKALQKYAMDITIADNGQLALELLDKHDIDLVLMDIMMPIMDGYEAIGLIRQNPRFHNLPVIALTAKAMAGDREKCLDAGASDYLTKPIDIALLINKLKIWLNII